MRTGIFLLALLATLSENVVPVGGSVVRMQKRQGMDDWLSAFLQILDIHCGEPIGQKDRYEKCLSSCECRSQCCGMHDGTCNASLWSSGYGDCSLPMGAKLPPPKNASVSPSKGPNWRDTQDDKIIVQGCSFDQKLSCSVTLDKDGKFIKEDRCTGNQLC